MRLFRLICMGYLVMALSGCGSDDDAEKKPTTETCADGDKKCVDGKLAVCKDGAFGDPVACKADEMCHVMDGKIDHCMAKSAAGGDAMSHAADGGGMQHHGDATSHGGDGGSHAGDAMSHHGDAMSHGADGGGMADGK